MDARGTRYGTLKELLLYCYRVAGTVGLMMSHVMGLRDECALKHAADLGIAMQLTNIARDITEDAAMGRIYLPLSWLQEAQIPVAEIAAREHREKLAMLSLRLLREADRYYRSGDARFMASFVSLGLCGLGGAAGLFRDRLPIAQERSARVGSTNLCDGAPESMGRFARRAEFAQVGAGASVEAVVSCALAHGVEIFKCSVN